MATRTQEPAFSTLTERIDGTTRRYVYGVAETPIYFSQLWHAPAVWIVQGPTGVIYGRITQLADHSWLIFDTADGGHTWRMAGVTTFDYALQCLIEP